MIGVERHDCQIWQPTSAFRSLCELFKEDISTVNVRNLVGVVGEVPHQKAIEGRDISLGLVGSDREMEITCLLAFQNPGATADQSDDIDCYTDVQRLY